MQKKIEIIITYKYIVFANNKTVQYIKFAQKFSLSSLKVMFLLMSQHYQFICFKGLK